LGPIPNPQSPIPNPHYFFLKTLLINLNKKIIKKILKYISKVNF